MYNPKKNTFNQNKKTIYKESSLRKIILVTG